jgi:hypothetical protein
MISQVCVSIGSLIPRKRVGSGSKVAAWARTRLESSHEGLRRHVVFGEVSQDLREVDEVEQFEAHVARMTGGRGPYRSTMAHRVDDRAEASRTLAEDAAPTLAAAAELRLDLRQHFVDEEAFPESHRGTVDILVAAKPCEAIREGDGGRRHRARTDQPIEPLRQVLAVVLP